MSRNMLARAKAALFDVAPTGSYVPSFLPRREPIPDGGARILKLPRHMLAGEPVDLAELETAINATETETMTTTDTAQTGVPTSAAHADIMREQIAALDKERATLETQLADTRAKFEEYQADTERKIADNTLTARGYEAALAVIEAGPVAEQSKPAKRLTSQ
jgi:hypothetical protein